MSASVAPPTSANPFESEGVGIPRLVWAPEVHEHYKEICNFYLVRLVTPQLSHSFTWPDLLAKASIKSFSIYPIYGHFDFLVRLWVTPQKRTHFLRLVENPGLFDEVIEFQVRKVDYLWAPAPHGANGDGRDAVPRVKRNLSDIDRLSKALDARAGLDDDVVARLVQNRLVYRLPAITVAENASARDTRFFKFYFALSRIPSPTRPGREFESTSIRDFLGKLQQETGMQQITVNEGLGFADYLIKGVVADYYSIFECNRRLNELIDHSKLALRPETYLIGTPTPLEFDYVDVGWREFATEEVRLEESLPPGFAADLATLKREDLREIADVFEKYEKRFIDTPFERFFKDLLCARISRNSDLLSTAMSVLHRIEGYAITFLRSLWIKELGPKWFQELKQAGAGVKLEGFDPNKCTLKEAMDVSNNLPLIRARVQAELGNNWVETITALLRYRNDLAHGTIYTEHDYVVKHWPDLSKSLFEAGVLYNRLFDNFHDNKQKEH